MDQKLLHLTTGKTSLLLSIIAASCLFSFAIGWLLASPGAGLLMLLFTAVTAGTNFWRVTDEMVSSHKDSFRTWLMTSSVQILLLIAGILVLEFCSSNGLPDAPLPSMLTGAFIGCGCSLIVHHYCQKWRRATANRQPTPTV